MSVALSDDRTRFQRMLRPTAGVTAVLAATVYIGAIDPNAPGHYPPCPLKYLTGIDCPACGGLRCVHSLANGDILGALDHNLLAVLMFPLVIVWAAMALRRRWTGETPEPSPTRASRQQILMTSLIAVTIIFTIARNLPFVPFIGSGIG